MGGDRRRETRHRNEAVTRRCSVAPTRLTPREDRALELQSILAERGQHRAPSIPDLLIAATAELAELTVLHVDKDFELVADVTGQQVERLDID